MKYFFLNKELSTTTGEVVVRKVSSTPVMDADVTAELGDENWVKYESPTGELPVYLKWDSNRRMWISTPPENWKMKHLYTGMDMYSHFYHEGNIDFSKFKTTGDNTYYTPIEINHSTAITYPNNSKMQSYKTDGTVVNMLYINDRNNLKLVDTPADGTPINIEHTGDMFVAGNTYVRNIIQSEEDVVVKKTENGKANLYSLLELYKEIAKLKEELEEVKKTDNTPIGTICAFGSLESIPLDYLICNGKTFDEELFPELRGVLGTNKLPDLRSVFLRGLDMGRNLDYARAPMSFQEGSKQTLIPHRHITGSYKSSSGDDWIPVQDFNKVIQHSSTEIFSGRQLDGSGDDNQVVSSFAISGFGGRTVTYTTYQTDIAPGANLSQRSIYPDNVGVIYAIKATNINGKKKGHTEDITGGLENVSDTVVQGLSDAQFNKMRLLYNMLFQKYDKTGGRIDGDMNAENLTATGIIDILNGGYFENFNDLAEKFESDVVYEEGYVLSNVEGIAKKMVASESNYIVGLSIPADKTGMLLRGFGEPDNAVLTPVILKGRGYARTSENVTKCSRLYLSETDAGFVSTKENKHFVGYAVDNSKDGMVRVFLRT